MTHTDAVEIVEKLIRENDRTAPHDLAKRIVIELSGNLQLETELADMSAEIPAKACM